MSVSPFKTALTNILLPSPVFSTDSIGGLAALSQLSPGSFDSTQPTLAQAFLLGSQSPVTSQAGAPFGSNLVDFSSIPASLPVATPAPEPAPVVIRPPVERDERDDSNDRFEHHPPGGPPGQMKKQGDGDHRGPGNGNNFRPGNPGNNDGHFNRKGGI